VFNDMRGHIDRALEWIDTCGNEAGNGYLSYRSRSSKGLGNQGWKDSGDAIMNADGTLAKPPISLVEVQGYVYRAKLVIADLYARSGENDRPDKLRTEARDLKSRFNRDFWITSKDYYAIALQNGERPAVVISSNPGQALWAGIIDESKANSVVHHLIASDMFTGWGIRTLSQKERRFNPIGYHLGSVWPHDNKIIAAGFSRYGFDQQAVLVLEGLLRAAGNFEHFRPPELFGGFSDQQYHLPVRCPVTCHPQAWASGSVPLLLSCSV
jgi:glycogen debranching enzyme